MIEKNIEIIALIYQSLDYLEFISEQMNSYLCKADGWKVGTRIVANNATPEVVKALRDCKINYNIYLDPRPEEYYINRVYRCHNYAAKTSAYDNICFINSDILMSPDWLENLLRHHDGRNIPVSRLVESGKMPTADGRHGVNIYFGSHPKNIQYNEWLEFSKQMQEPTTLPGGLLGPVVFEKSRFMEAGMYPEGNIYADGVGTCNGQVLNTSDVFFFKEILENKFGMQHITVCDSICYHIQEGEKDA